MTAPKKTLLLISMLTAITVVAQNDNVTFYQDRKVTELTDVYKTYNKRNDVTEGYRIQIAFSNDRQEAYTIKSKIYKELPDEKCYVEYEEPYYKLRIGDYSTRLEAYDKLRAVISKYPGAFVVKAKVKIH
jgi:SPOR domain